MATSRLCTGLPESSSQLQSPPNRVSTGLVYLKGRRIVHGDLKGANVLISTEEGYSKPLLCDFGVSKALGVRGFTTEMPGSVPWMAPELLSPKDEVAVHTYESDVWASGMTVYELFMDQRPFHGIQGLRLSTHISSGGLPEYPGSDLIPAGRGLSPELWKLLSACWEKNPQQRPSISAIECALPVSAFHNHQSSSIEETSILPSSDPEQLFAIHGPTQDLTEQVTLQGRLPVFSNQHTDLYMAKWNGKTSCVLTPRYIGSCHDDAQIALFHKRWLYGSA